MSQKARCTLAKQRLSFGCLTAGVQSRNKSWGGVGVKQDSGERLSQFEGAISGAASSMAAVRNVDPPSAGAVRSSLGAAPAAGEPVDPEWLEAMFSRLDMLLCSLADSSALGRLLLRELAPLIGAAQGALYVLDTGAPREGAQLSLQASYAAGPELPERWALGEGLVGQCALELEKRVVRGLPSEFFRVRSALGSSAPAEIAFVPVWLDTSQLAVVELAFTDGVTPARDALLDRLAQRRPRVQEPGALGAAAAPAPSPAGSTLALVRQGHKFGFWGKLSHELRSPLNSVLVLSQLLAENSEANLTAKQVAFAAAIHSSGNDLLALVNAISDLAKIQNNRLVLEPTEMHFDHFQADMERAFLPVAQQRGLEFLVQLAPGLPDGIVTDSKRVRQILKCLLSNAFKFTESGGVVVRVELRTSGWPVQHERLAQARQVIAFSVSDTGVGMSESERHSIFDAFPPDRVEARRGAGASGLGLAISRELARLLGGVLEVESQVGTGSTFTLYLPAVSAGPRLAEEASPESGPERPARDSGLMLSAAAPLLGAPARDERSDQAVGSAGSSSPGSGGAELRRARPAELFGRSILLVDDDVRSAFTLTGFLERQGAEVVHAEDVREALAQLAAGLEASALLIDAELLEAGADGLAASLLSERRLPIIALTRAAGNPRLPREVQQLPKPVDPQHLLAVLMAAVSPPAGF
jgi:signal transduction histidine kinase